MLTNEKEIAKTPGCSMVTAEELNLDHRITEILCHGYDITGKFADPEYVSVNAILDLNELCKSNRVHLISYNSFNSLHIENSSVTEASQKYEKELGIKASGGLFGFSFKSETRKTTSEENYNKSNLRTASTKIFYKKDGYIIEDYDDVEKLKPFLTEQFKKDIENETLRRIVQKYGTHVMLGMIVGAKLDYSMSYLQSVSRSSTVKSFSTVNEISFKKTGVLTGKAIPNSNAQRAANALATINGGNFTNCTFNNFILNPSDLAAQAQGGGSAQKPGKIEIGAGVEYDESSSSDVYEENESTKILIEAVGGDGAYLTGVSSLNKAETSDWAKSVASGNYIFCGYPKGTLVPIYEFVDGENVDKLKEACEIYFKEEYELEHCVLEQRIPSTYQGGAEKIGGSDCELYGTETNPTIVELHFEAVNIEGGAVALAVLYRVSEVGSDTNLTRDDQRTVLQMTKVIDFSFAGDLEYKYAVDPAIKSTYDLKFTVTDPKRGVESKWFDISEKLMSDNLCPFVKIDCKERVLVRVDGPDDKDQNAIGIKARFCIPVVKYKRHDDEKEFAVGCEYDNIDDVKIAKPEEKLEKTIGKIKPAPAVEWN